MRRDIQPVDRFQIASRARVVAERIFDLFAPRTLTDPVYLYGIPRGGCHAAHHVLNALHRKSTMFELVYHPKEADVFIDDLADSGTTQQRYAELFPQVPFLTLFDKRVETDLGWLVFPWEGDETGSIEDSTRRLLQYIGEDPNRDGLKDTPSRVARAWRDWTCGYKQDVKDLLRMFENDGAQYNEMVVVKDLRFYSHCEHHLAPFFGTATIAYVPNGKIVGLSKLGRVLEVYARRLQVQERLTAQIADALMEHLEPKGAAVQVRAEHFCMASRGIHKQDSETVTQALRGVFYDDARTRAEFLDLAK